MPWIVALIALYCVSRTAQKGASRIVPLRTTPASKNQVTGAWIAMLVLIIILVAAVSSLFN